MSRDVSSRPIARPASASASALSGPAAASSDALFLGLDFGTSGARACAVDALGAIVAERSARYPPIVDGGKGGDGVPEGGWAEAWRGALWSLLDGLDAEVLDRVAAVAVDGTSGTTLMVDAASLEPLAPAQMYNEKRPESVDAVESIAPEGHCVRSASSALCKLHAWWHVDAARAPDPDALRTSAKLVHHADWVAALMHGRVGVSDHNNALKLGFDPAGEEGGFYPEWLTAQPYAAALPLEVYAPGTAIPNGEVRTPEASRYLGRTRPCAVVAGTTDSVAAFVAATCVEPGDAVTSLGSSLALKLVSKTRVDDAAAGVYSHRLCGDWLVGGASNLGGWLLRTHFTDDELSRLTDALDASSDVLSDGSAVPEYFANVLMGFGLSVEEATAAMTPRPASDADFLRAILDGVAGVEARSYAALVAMGASHAPTRVFTAGGGAKNAKWAALRSRKMGGVEVRASEQAEAAFGAALLARMGGLGAETYVP